MSVPEPPVFEHLREELRAGLPSGRQVCAQAIAAQLGSHAEDTAWIKRHFSELVESIQIAAYETYLAAERPAAINALRKVFGPMLPEPRRAEDLFVLLEDNFVSVDKLFLGLTQGRRARAGKAFEELITVLFDKLRYPYTPQPIINGQPDFLLPSVERFRENPLDCIIFTAKRTLRERWRQIVTEGLRGYMFFLATIDEGISDGDLAEILHHRIYLVTPERIRSTRYPTHSNVISFETFFDQHLDPAMARWRANGIIE